MRKLKLTKRAIDALEPGDRRETYWDSEVVGFGLRIAPNGGRTYVLKYRVGDRQRWFRIGRHGSPWTPESARKEATRLLGDVARGADPSEMRADARKAMSFAELCELYFAEGAAHKKRSTLRSDRGRAKLHLVPLLGPKRADALTRGDIERLLNTVMNGRAASPKPEKRRAGSIMTGGPGAAAQCVALASSILQFAVQRGLRADNPARGIKKPPVRKMQRFLSFAELRRLAESLDVEIEETNAVHAVAAIRLLALTGCRRGEIVGLRWADVDLERRFLQLRDSKTREKAVYLSAGAVDVLESLPRFAKNPFVIAGGGAGKPSGAVDKTWSRVRKRAGLPDVRLHDLRHTFASVGAGASVGLPIIGKLLGHTQASTTARYAHLANDPIRAAADAIGATIAAAMAERGAEVAQAGIGELRAQRDG
jgi:integrase